MRKLLLFTLLCLPVGLRAQQNGAILGAAATTTCSAPSNAVLVVAIAGNQGGASFTVTANASANTISFFASGDNQTTWFALNVTASNSQSPVTTTTGTGTFQANVAGYSHVCMEISSFVGGTTTVSIRPGTASARSGGGSGLPAGCTSPANAQLQCSIFIATSAFNNVGAAAQSVILHGSGDCNGTTCTGTNEVGWSAPPSVSSPLLWQMPTNDGTKGQVLQTDGAKHTTWVSVGGVNATNFYEFDEFLAGDVAANNVSKLGWSTRGSGAGPSFQNGSWPHIGVVQFDSGATSGNAGILELTNSTNGNQPLGAIGSNGAWDSHFIFKLSENAVETMEIGYDDTNATKPDTINSIIIRYLAGTDTKFLEEVCQAGVCTSNSTNSVTVDTNWHNLRVFSTTTGEISYSIDAGLITCFTAAASGGCTAVDGITNTAPTTVVNSAHVPTTVQMPTMYLLTSENVDKHLQADYWGFAATVAR